MEEGEFAEAREDITWLERIANKLQALAIYSGRHWKVYECCFMKQNCHFQSGVLQCKIATKPLISSGIHTTH